MSLTHQSHGPGAPNVPRPGSDGTDDSGGVLGSFGGESGTGLVGTVAGVTAFLFFLLFAVQVAVTLYATSTTNAAGYDAARAVASARIDHHDPREVRSATRDAERRLRDLLGERGDDANVTWELNGGAVHLHVVVDAPGIVPSSIRDTSGLRRIDRTFVVRIEEVPT
ncbi:MAG: hypothetical protein KDB02_04510 [Acidimicrobiales bacterium]|nr:hypothetical protein [Acidimicrobiales bacterium]